MTAAGDRPVFRLREQGTGGALDVYSHYDVPDGQNPGGYSISIVTCFTCDCEHVCVRPQVTDIITCPYCLTVMHIETGETVQ